jgi:CheY-like chemotaxis protein
MRDVSRERQLEQQLHHSQKMEAVGRLAGGIAHDFNNLVMVINGYGDMMLAHGQDGTLLRYAEEVTRAGERAALLTRQLLAFSRQQSLAPQILDLNATVASTERMLRRLIGEDIELQTRLGADLGCIRADPGQIVQVIMNLAVNARDAMPRGGRLMIETSGAEVEAGRASSPLPAGRYVVLSMSDTGFGMTSETQARMFEPFFTTKEAGKGTGLGLSTAYGIVTQSGGFIECTSELNAGTTFRVHLPQAEAPPDPLPRPEPRATGACGVETILLVEDEESVRRLVREGLQSLGYIVLDAGDGEEALAVASRHAQPVQLLLTDVVMPDMSGPELVRRLSRVRPETRWIFMSGYNEEATAHHGVVDGEVPYLQKPFSLGQLAGRIREVLDGAPASPDSPDSVN